MKKSIVGILLLTFIAVGCQVGPPYTPPTASVPENWKYARQNDVKSTKNELCQWWEIFDDSLLNDLEERALEHNNTLYAALARVFQARALAGIARADLFPQFNLMPVYSNQTILEELFGINEFPLPPGARGLNPFIREHQRTYALPLTLHYELDLWGKIRSLYHSATYHAQAEADALQQTLLILTTDLANNYFILRSLDSQIDLFLETVKVRQKALDINESRFKAQIAIYSDVSRASTELTNAKADYEEAVRQRALVEDNIAVLIGVPASALSIAHYPLSAPPPSIPAGLPSEVLLQRPDIAEAERKRASEHALIGAAYASFFPSVELTGVLGFSSPNFKQFLSWKSRWWGVGVKVDQTVFDGGRKFSTLELAWARFQEADRDYQQQVLIAFQEVEDALISIEKFAREYEEIAQSVESTKKTYKITSDRYLRGVTFYLDVVDAERQELESQRRLISLLDMRYRSTILLIKALGGSW